MKRKDLQVHLIQNTPNAEQILSFAKDTRLLGSFDDKDEYSPRLNMLNADLEYVMKNVEYSLNTIRGPLEFIHYIFLITNASRGFTHQLVRHRVASFAQQSLRVSDEVGYYMPPKIAQMYEAKELYEAHVLNSKNIYDDLVSLGIDMQDSRGVLPINTTSAILMKVNLRAFLEMMEIRLCLRVQGENRSAMIQMSGIVKEIHPWVKHHIGPICATKGICAFPRYDCPVSKAHPVLKGLSQDKLKIIKAHVDSFGDLGLAPKTQKEK